MYAWSSSCLDEFVPVCAPRIPEPKLRRAIEGLKSVRDLEALPVIWREFGAGTRAVVESVLKDSGVNPRKLDQRFELGSTEAIKSLVIAGLWGGLLFLLRNSTGNCYGSRPTD